MRGARRSAAYRQPAGAKRPAGRGRTVLRRAGLAMGPAEGKRLRDTPAGGLVDCPGGQIVDPRKGPA